MSAHVTVLFDGVCNLCNGTVRFIMANDPAGRFRFAALNSQAANAVLARYDRADERIGSIIVIDEDGLHERSDAALRIARGLRAPWRWFAAFAVLPTGLRDAIYAVVAQNRYRWFGRQSTCMLPTPAQRERFLTDETTSGGGTQPPAHARAEVDAG